MAEERLTMSERLDLINKAKIKDLEINNLTTGGINFGYESPITRVMGDIQTQIIQDGENKIFQAVQNCEIKVDKEELIKALQYDRGQYEKGYKEGAIVELENIRHKIVEEIYKTKGYVTYGNALNYCYCLVDERIEKLKGEQE